MYMDFGRRKQFPARNDSSPMWTLITQNKDAKGAHQVVADEREAVAVVFDRANLENQEQKAPSSVNSGDVPRPSSDVTIQEQEVIPQWARNFEQSLEKHLDERLCKIHDLLQSSVSPKSSLKRSDKKSNKSNKSGQARSASEEVGSDIDSSRSRKSTSKKSKKQKKLTYHQIMDRERASLQRSKERRDKWESKRKQKNSETPILSRDHADTWVANEMGKPPFFSFGRANTTPVSPESYMLSHNVMPEREPNSPRRQQVTGSVRYIVAEGKYPKSGRGVRSKKSASASVVSKTPRTAAHLFGSSSVRAMAADSETARKLAECLAKEEELLARERQLKEREQQLYQELENAQALIASARSPSQPTTTRVAWAEVPQPAAEPRRAESKSEPSNIYHISPARHKQTEDVVKPTQASQSTPNSAVASQSVPASRPQSAHKHSHVDMTWIQNNPTKAHRAINQAGLTEVLAGNWAGNPTGNLNLCRRLDLSSVSWIK